MALDLWSHQFCLACDKQVDSDASAYCSETCRLAELERLSTPSSQASSPGQTPPSYPWTSTSTQPSTTSSTKFHLTPAYDFSKAEPYGASSALFGNYKMDAEKATQASARRSTLSPSSSHTSLCSIQSSTSTADNGQLSDRAKQELRAYAVSFEHVRSQRRRSY